MKQLISQIAYSLFSHAPKSWEKKFAMMMDLRSTDWHRIRKLTPMSMEFPVMPDLEKHFQGLDAESMATLRRFVAKLHFVSDAPHLYATSPSYAYLWSGLCTPKEFEEAVANREKLRILKSKYHVQHSEESSLIHHHGLRYLPPEVLEYLNNKVFIDAGAFEGDSTLVFLQYHSQTVWAFEPSPPNQQAFRNTMQANNVPENMYQLFPLGLSDKNTTVHFSAKARSDVSLNGRGRCTAQIVPLDSLTSGTHIGLIKADLEGMGMFMLRGAVQTIHRDKPVLALSIYHNTDEFLNTYPFLQSLGLSYEYKILSLCPPWENHELTLLAWPRDLDQ